MKHLQKASKKPLLNAEQGEVLISVLDDESKQIAKSIFVDGFTCEEAAEKFNYSVRQMERIKANIMKTALKKLIEKQIPKKPYILNYGGYKVESWHCPNGHIIDKGNCFCKHCSQAIDWSDSE